MLNEFFRVERGPVLSRSLRDGTASAFLAALAFGASGPLAKTIVGEMPRVSLAVLFYVGAAAGLALMSLVRRPARERSLKRSDVPMLLLVSFTGGLAPMLQLYGLETLSGATGALLIGLELPFTALVAVLAFGETLGMRQILGLAVIVSGGALLAVVESDGRDEIRGVLATTAACAIWAFDSNLTQRLSERDPVSVSRVKALVAAAFFVLLFLRSSVPWPHDASVAGIAMAAGFLSFGASEVLFVNALRHLGATRTGGVYAMSPFLGAAVSIPLLRVVPPLATWGAGTVMAAGIALMLRGSQAERRRET